MTKCEQQAIESLIAGIAGEVVSNVEASCVYYANDCVSLALEVKFVSERLARKLARYVLNTHPSLRDTSTSIENIGMSIRTYNILKTNRILTVNDLRDKINSNTLKGCDPKSYIECCYIVDTFV